MSTLERIWLAYLAAVLGVALLADGGASPGYRPGAFVALHLGLTVVQLGVVFVARRSSPGVARAVRYTVACVSLPIVFSALSMLLPHVHPQPFEYAWFAVDLWLVGDDASELAARGLPDLLVPVLQLVYASFYLLPVAAVWVVARRRGVAAGDRAIVMLVGGFLASYLGYLLFPTLAPKVVFPEAGVPARDGLSGAVREFIDLAELNPWDCFPSGHTWLSITSWLVVLRWAPRAAPWFALVVVPLIVSTVALRYHWPIDVVVGAALAWPAMRACELLLDRDGAPPA